MEPGPTAEEPVDGSAFGWWPSPWSPARVAAGKVSRSGLHVEGEVAYWTESRPAEGGRQVVVCAGADGAPVDVSPPGVHVRSRVHEYGGGAFTVAGGTLFYSDADDERLYRCPLGGTGAVPLTPEGEEGTTVRLADGRCTPSGRWLVAVEERIAAGRTSHRLVAVATDGSLRVRSLVSGPDFVAAPRVSPDGALIVFTCWDHPAMPWDRSQLRVARLDESDDDLVATPSAWLAGGRVSVGQPHWGRDGSLLFVDEGSGWWLPVRLDADAVTAHAAGAAAPRRAGPEGADRVPEARPLVAEQAEFHAPDWALGQSTMAELPDGTVVARRRRSGTDQLVRLAPVGGGVGPWATEVVDQPCVAVGGVAAGDDGAVWVLGSTPTAAQVVVRGGPVGLGAGFLRRSTGGPDPDRPSVATAEPFVASGPVVPVPGLFFAPVGPPDDSRPRGAPPLVVFCHGGPTASAEPGFDPVVQFFASRGLAVAVVDYRGSTGYGRAYRQLLEGRWGVADVEDCAAFAAGLAAAGRVDGRRMAIRGTSAGGLTALASLVGAGPYLGAASWYGVTDLEGLVQETHDFESRYLDSLVGPWPEAEARYRQRSPVHHAAQVSGEVLLLQGEEDRVVPAGQAERFAAELRDQGRRCRLVVFPGEAHGFRRAETVEASLVAELDFYRGLFAPDGASG